MRITLRELRGYIRNAIVESGGGTPNKAQPYMGNAMSPGGADREQLGSLANVDTDTVDDQDELPSHLREPNVDFEDCYGPVPPVVPDPYVSQDPFTRDTSPLPTPPIKR